MGRLHERDQTKSVTEEELRGVFDLTYCWSSVTSGMDGPDGSEYVFSFKDCESRKR
jgi:hypothetical protein